MNMDTDKSRPQQFNIGLIQMSCSSDPKLNLEKAIERIRQSARDGAQIVCLQELFLSPYFCQTEDVDMFDLAETIPGPATEALVPIAKSERVVLIVPIFERRAAGVYHNSAVVIDADGSLLGIYRKMHIPDDPCYFEKFYFTPGDLGFKVFDTKYARVGVLVCWDQWYPEAARLIALQGASVIFYPTAIGHHPTEKADHGTAQQDAWELVQRSHAVTNGVYVAAANRVGHEGHPDGAGDGLDFWGGSFVADPFGSIIKRAENEKEQVLVVGCDLKILENTRRNWPFLRDRRIDAYGPITQRVIDEQLANR